jgi:hypothetical protein
LVIHNFLHYGCPQIFVCITISFACEKDGTFFNSPGGVYLGFFAAKNAIVN